MGDNVNMLADQFCTKRSDRWFAVRVRSRAEKTVATMAQQRGIQEFLPVYESRRRWSDRIKSVEVPLFPGYVFCRLDPDRRLPLLTIPGVLQIVGQGRTPIPVDDSEIAALQAASFSGLQVEPCPFLKIGERFRLEAGPLAGVEGLLVEIRNHCRLVLSVSLLNRSVAVEIDRDWVTPLSEQGHPVAPIQFKAFHPESPCAPPSAIF
jgi:transcription antitermination factor NusG